MGFVFLLGGARSGKSDRAQQLATESGLPVTVIATATAGDDEMIARIQHHRASRPHGWSTIEEPIDLAAAIQSANEGDFVIVDCLTLWVSNLLEAGSAPDAIRTAAEISAAAMADRRGVVVSNEVGLGIVPANPLARTYRDVLGAVNAGFARCAERSVLMVAGRLLELA